MLLTSLSPWLAQPAFYPTWDHLPKEGTTHSELGLLTPQICSQTNLRGHFSIEVPSFWMIFTWVKLTKASQLPSQERADYW